jgi:hypothetical protein
MPRYEQISALNVNHVWIFAMETPPHAFLQGGVSG